MLPRNSPKMRTFPAPNVVFLNENFSTKSKFFDKRKFKGSTSCPYPTTSPLAAAAAAAAAADDDDDDDDDDERIIAHLYRQHLTS